MFVREAAYVPVALAGQYVPSGLMDRARLRGLRDLVDFASAHVPYYRERPAYARRIGSLEDVRALPILTKKDMRTIPTEQLLADGLDADACRHFTTSGTTGHRVHVLHDPRSYDYHMAASVRRFLATHRYRPTDRISHLRPSPMPVRRFESLGLFRREVVLSTQPVQTWVEQLLAQRPHTLLSFPVHLRRLLREISPEDLDRLRASLRCVMTESELLRPEHRRQLEEGFGVPVFDEYSSFEVLNVYYECHAGGLHVPADRVLVEVVDEHGRPVPPGVEGEVVCTAYRERGMPLIRYAMGDIGMLDPTPCSCARRFPVMRLTRGRTITSLRMTDGSVVGGDVFLCVGAFVPGIDEVCVRQDADGRVRLLVVPEPGRTIEGLASVIRAELDRLVGRHVPVDIERIDAIPVTPGGKGDFVVSHFDGTRELNNA